MEHFRSTSTLNFDQFKYYLLHEVFSSVSSSITLEELKDYESRIAEVCWLICRPKYQNRETQILNDNSVFQIFRIFCLLGELIEGDIENSYQVVLHPIEATMVAETLSNSLGNNFDEEDFNNLCTAIGCFRLHPFIAVLETRCIGEVNDIIAISEAVADLHQTLVDDVIKKGPLLKKGSFFLKYN